MCCHETACRDCVESKMIKTVSEEVVSKGQFKCFYCLSEHSAAEDIEKPIAFGPN